MLAVKINFFSFTGLKSSFKNYKTVFKGRTVVLSKKKSMLPHIEKSRVMSAFCKSVLSRKYWKNDKTPVPFTEIELRGFGSLRTKHGEKLSTILEKTEQSELKSLEKLTGDGWIPVSTTLNSTKGEASLYSVEKGSPEWESVVKTANIFARDGEYRFPSFIDRIENEKLFQEVKTFGASEPDYDPVIGTHGTHPSRITDIVANGFKPYISEDGVLGKGTYFGSHAYTSYGYSDSKHGEYILLCVCFLGDIEKDNGYCRGAIPHPYGSRVNDSWKDEFMIQDRLRAYPAYLMMF